MYRNNQYPIQTTVFQIQQPTISPYKITRQSPIAEMNSPTPISLHKDQSPQIMRPLANQPLKNHSVDIAKPQHNNNNNHFQEQIKQRNVEIQQQNELIEQQNQLIMRLQQQMQQKDLQIKQQNQQIEQQNQQMEQQKANSVQNRKARRAHLQNKRN